MSQPRRASFVVRVVQDRRGQVTGVIERVATGAKEAFTSIEAVVSMDVRNRGNLNRRLADVR